MGAGVQTARELAEIASRLAALASRLAADADPGELVPIVDAAQIARCSVRTLTAARRAGELVMYGRQRSRTVRRADLVRGSRGRSAVRMEGLDGSDDCVDVPRISDRTSVHGRAR